MSEVWILNEMGTPADGLPQLPGEGAVEAYRIRVHARGRDAADALTVDSSVDGIEEHLLVAWPAPVASENHIKLTDAVGRRRR